MVRRGNTADFMGGAHVFPGGGVDDIDRSDLAYRVVRFSGDPDEVPWRSAALRELAEEVGVVLSNHPVDVAGLRGTRLFTALEAAGCVLEADRLEYLSNWVTPIGLPRRYDTRFYVTVVPTSTVAASDRVEVFDAVWVTPVEALGKARAGEWYVEFPTRRHLELLAGFDTAAEVFDHALTTTPARIEPRLVATADGSWRVLLPGDRGYAEAAG
jgi:8-oxo-dGTP pyrophosphatase MutT (NUDIX family)